MNKNDIGCLAVALGIIYFGINLFMSTGAYSYKSRAYVQFISSPYKEIFAVCCIAWGFYFIYVMVRAYIKRRGSH